MASLQELKALRRSLDMRERQVQLRELEVGLSQNKPCQQPEYCEKANKLLRVEQENITKEKKRLEEFEKKLQEEKQILEARETKLSKEESNFSRKSILWNLMTKKIAKVSADKATDITAQVQLQREEESRLETIRMRIRSKQNEAGKLLVDARSEMALVVKERERLTLDKARLQVEREKLEVTINSTLGESQKREVEYRAKLAKLTSRERQLDIRESEFARSQAVASQQLDDQRSELRRLTAKFRSRSQNQENHINEKREVLKKQREQLDRIARDVEEERLGIQT